MSSRHPNTSTPQRLVLTLQSQERYTTSQNEAPDPSRRHDGALLQHCSRRRRKECQVQVLEEQARRAPRGSVSIVDRSDRGKECCTDCYHTVLARRSASTAWTRRDIALGCRIFVHGSCGWSWNVERNSGLGNAPVIVRSLIVHNTLFSIPSDNLFSCHRV